tara:strand:- start:1175 stop:1435 length:261 start_codon:yes stop_codon:yes gene_type:complete
MPNEDTVPVDRHVLLAMLDEAFDVIEWLHPRSLHPSFSEIDAEAFIEAHKNLVAEFEKHTVDQIVEDLADSENVTSIFTKLRFFRE